jgi:superfamily II DNA/RNA helicase
VLAPSRELVQQIHSVAEAVFADMGVRSVPLIGGANIDHQIDLLRERRPQLIIATPGRLAEIALSKEKLRLTQVRSFIVDEADNLMEDAFRGDVEALLQACTPLRNRTNPRPEPVITASPAAQVLVDRMQREQSEGAGMYDFFIPDNLDISLDSIGEEVDEQLDDMVELSDESQKIVKLSKKSTASKPEATGAPVNDKCNDGTLVVLVSATALSNAQVQAFADTASMHSGEWTALSVNASDLLPRNIYHGLISSRRFEAIDALHHILTAKPDVERALIFVNQPKTVDFVCQRLYRLGFVAAPLHGEASKLDRKVIVDRMYLLFKIKHVYYLLVSRIRI